MKNRGKQGKCEKIHRDLQIPEEIEEMQEISESPAKIRRISARMPTKLRKFAKILEKTQILEESEGPVRGYPMSLCFFMAKAQ